MNDTLLRCVHGYRSAPDTSELEVRLGHDAVSFTPGVCKDTFEQLERDLTESHLDGDGGWTELIDYHYNTSDGDHIRTRVTFDKERIEVRREHTRKTTECSAVLGRAEHDGGESCRVALSREIPVVDVPDSCLPYHVRIKQRRCFRDRRDGAVTWVYELSKTWSASGRSAVEHLQHVSEPVYEVECELVDESGAYVAARTDAEVLASLMMKAKMLLGDEAHGPDLVVMHEAATGRKRKGGQTSSAVARDTPRRGRSDDEPRARARR